VLLSKGILKGPVLLNDFNAESADKIALHFNVGFDPNTGILL